MTRRESIEHMLKINLEDALEFVQDGLYNSACNNRSMEDCGDDRDCNDCRAKWLDTEITEDVAQQIFNWLGKHENDTLKITIQFKGLNITEDMPPRKNRLMIVGCDKHLYFCPNKHCSLGLKPLFCYANQQTLRAFTEQGSIIFTIE